MRTCGQFLKTCCSVFRTLSMAGARSARRSAKQANRKRPCSPLRARPNLRRIRWTHARLGAALQTLNRPQEAIVAFRRALEAAPDLVEARVALGACLRQTGELQSARVELERAVTLRPSDGRAWFALGLVCEDLRDTPGAIEAYRRSIEAQPDVPEAHVNLGLNLQNAGDLDAAMDSYRRAMRLRPDTFGRIAQALTSAKKGRLWLNSARLRRLLEA